MGCCSWFDLFFSQDSKRKAGRPSISSYPRGSSQEHLLADEAAKQLATESAQDRVPPSTQQYVSPSIQEYDSPSPPESDGDKAGHIVKVALNSSLRRVALDPSLRNVSFDNLGLAASTSHHVWRPRHIKFSRCAIRGEDYSGKKMINNYVREGNIGIGSYSKVVLCRNVADEELYAMKIVQKSRLRRIKVAPSETALTDVYKEVSIMKELDHPNIVKLIEVIDDSECDRLYMILEYIEGRCMFEGSGPPGGIGEATARIYFRDVVAGVVYLHSRRIIHGDIKPENLLISASGQVKICDFSVSQRFQGNNDELRRSPGTPVYTAPECIAAAIDDTPMLVNYLVTRLQQAMGNLALQGEVQQQLYAFGILPPLQGERDLETSHGEISKGSLSTVREVENPYKELRQLLEGMPPSKRKSHAPHEEPPSKERERSESRGVSMEDVAPRKRRPQRSPTPPKRKRSRHSPPCRESKREEKNSRKNKERKRSPSFPFSSPSSSSDESRGY
ncbi:hypothetical protein L7F22_018324 [Adiantum nelumboides]|nr:hypothetical protein [Adiantum nelumboides]